MPLKSAFKLPQLKLGGKIVLAAAAVFTTAIVGTLAYVVSSTTSHDLASADELLSQPRAERGDQCQAGAAGTFRHGRGDGAGRRRHDERPGDRGDRPTRTLLEGQINVVPNAVGIWVLLNRDAPTAANPFLTSSQFGLGDGYFGPYITRDLENEAINWGRLDLSLENGFKDWYLDPLAKGAAALVGPYLYEGMLYTSTTAVVHDEAGKAVGLAGVDYNGGVFAEVIGQSKPLGTGWVGLVNGDGIWVVAPDPALMGQPADDAASSAAVAGAPAGHYHASVALDGETWRMTAAVPAAAADRTSPGPSWWRCRNRRSSPRP